MTDYCWRIAAASVIGTSHLKEGIVCQDSHACRIFEDTKGKPVVALVASDGAGSAPRAHEGSALACRIISEAVEAFILKGGCIARADVEAVRNWVTGVKIAISAQADSNGSVPRDYACTLLAAIIADEAAAFLQIGDGAMVIVDEVGEWAWVHWPQKGEYVNTTCFITDGDADQQMAFAVVQRSIKEVAIFTDGIESLVLHYASKTVYAPFFDRMFIPVRASTDRGIIQDLSIALKRYLASPAICDRTDDDKTLILATRRPSVQLPTIVDPCHI